MVNVSMRIVHAVYSMEMGGAEMLVAQLCRVQRAAGHHVEVCAYSTLGVLGERLIEDGIAVHVLGEAHPLATMRRYFSLLRRLRPDVVHCHNPAPALQAALPARLAGARTVVLTRHSLVSPPYDRRAEMKLAVVAGLAIDRIAGICEITCSNLRAAPFARPRRIVRVYNGADAVAAAGFAPDPTHFTLVFVGRLAAIKDLPTMLRAVAIARERVPQLRLWVVGDGPVRAELERLAEELGIAQAVTFWGQQMQTDRFFAGADLFAMSSISEGLPMSLLQAMSAGKAAVATDVGGLAEIVRHTGGGLLVHAGDADAMAEAIVNLATDPERRMQLEVNARDSYAREFTLERMAQAYEQIYRS